MSTTGEGPLQTVMHVELSDGTRVVIETSGPLNAATADEVLDYWMVYQRVLQRRSCAEAPGVAMSKEPASQQDTGDKATEALLEFFTLTYGLNSGWGLSVRPGDPHRGEMAWVVLMQGKFVQYEEQGASVAECYQKLRATGLKEAP